MSYRRADFRICFVRISSLEFLLVQSESSPACPAHPLRRSSSSTFVWDGENRIASCNVAELNHFCSATAECSRALYAAT